MRVAGVDEVVPNCEDKPLTVLVVEDEILIRLAISDCLRQSGFVVLEAASAEEARMALKAMPEVGAVFSDVNMPDPQDGIGLALWMAAHLPDTPLILTSGRENAAQDAAIGALRNITHFVAKPYECEEIGRLLKSSIAESEQPKF